MLQINDSGNLIDLRSKDDIILNGGKISFCYTLIDDDITKGEKDVGVPFRDRKSEFIKIGDYYSEPNTGAKLTVSNNNDGVQFVLRCNNSEVSEWGLCFPFNFMSKKNGGKCCSQFLVNSPYITNDRRFKSVFLSKPNGNNLLLVVESDCDGWMIEYYQFHFFRNLKIFGGFDKVFGKQKRIKELKIGIYPVSGYNDALYKQSQIYNLPFMSLSQYSGKTGDRIELNFFGNCDGLIEVYNERERQIDRDKDYIISHPGVVELIPLSKGEKGAGVTLYGYNDLVDLYIRSMDSVDLKVIRETTDSNLCEHQCWAAATLRLLINHPEKISNERRTVYENRLIELFSEVMQTDVNLAKPRKTILNKEFEDYPAYNIFKSRRIQEQFFGISLFIDAYKYFKERKFLDYAVATTDCLIDNYQNKHGCIFAFDSNGVHDYSTVCSAMIPIVDMAKLVKEIDDVKYRKYLRASKNLAEYILNRGFGFSTEGEIEDELLDKEIEEGSVSCTALSLLYYCSNIERKEKYITFAKTILDFHDSWVMQTPLCNVNGSTLRWWETLFEGDKEGPSICCGHAWTIWRAEADWLYYNLTGNEKYKLKAINGFGSNFSKIDIYGNSYCSYNVEDIIGGGWSNRAEDVNLRIAPKLPQQVDCGLSRYVWVRANDTILKN